MATMHITGYQDCSYATFSDDDLREAWNYACIKPDPTSTQFANLASIIMREENIERPQNIKDTIILYTQLIDFINEIE